MPKILLLPQKVVFDQLDSLSLLWFSEGGMYLFATLDTLAFSQFDPPHLDPATWLLNEMGIPIYKYGPPLRFDQ